MSPRSETYEHPLADAPAMNPGLLEALAGMEDLDPLTLVRAQLEQQSTANPQAALLLRWLQRRQEREAERSAAAAEELETPTEASPPESEQEEMDQQRALAVADLNEKIASVYAELELLRGRNEQLAAALGACYVCFGDDPLCAECAGRGVPGALRPNPEAFRKYVIPAYRRAKSVEAARAQATRAGGR